MRPRSLLAGALLVAVSWTGLGACGADDDPESPPAAPGANVDPDADGVIGGSINKAKDVGTEAETRDGEPYQEP